MMSKQISIAVNILFYSGIQRSYFQSFINILVNTENVKEVSPGNTCCTKCMCIYTSSFEFMGVFEAHSQSLRNCQVAMHHTALD